MTRDELTEQVEFELSALHSVVDELDALLEEVESPDPGVRVSTLVGVFMQQFYNGIESILKRFCKAHGVPTPQGDRSHAELLSLFGPDRSDPLPALLDDALFSDLEPFRQFRHVFRTAYGFQLDWTRFAPGASVARSVLVRFEAAVRREI